MNGLNVYKYITYVLEKRTTEEMLDRELEKLLSRKTYCEGGMHIVKFGLFVDTSRHCL